MAYARPRLREVLGRPSQPPQIWPLEAGVGIGIAGELGTLAFDLNWAPAPRDARWVIGNARGAGRTRVALAHALRVAETLFAGVAERRGRVLTLVRRRRAVCVATWLPRSAPVPPMQGQRASIDWSSQQTSWRSACAREPRRPRSRWTQCARSSSLV